jgi:hypothetical protein
MASENLATLEANVAAMNGLHGFDVVVVCCSGEKQADYWQARLTAVRCVLRGLRSYSLVHWMQSMDASRGGVNQRRVCGKYGAVFPPLCLFPSPLPGSDSPM